MPEDVCGPRLRALRSLAARVEVAGRHQVTPWFRVPTSANANTLPSVRVAEVGGTLELVNHTRQQVTVLGSSLEPYLRVGAEGGVEENRRSPTWLASPPPGSPRPRSARVDVGGN